MKRKKIKNWIWQHFPYKLPNGDALGLFSKGKQIG